MIFNLNLSKKQLGLDKVDNTADADKSVKYAASATKATQDGSGNNIVNTYAKKTEVLHIVSFDSATGKLVTKSSDYKG